MSQGQAEALVPMIEHVLSDCDVSYSMLDRIAVTVGPGSFTGVRVGIATARALGFAASKMTVGIPTTEVLAATAPEKDRRILAAIDTKRGDLYVQMFNRDRSPIGNINVVDLENLKLWAGPDPVTVVGDGAVIALPALGPNASASSAGPLPNVTNLAELASTREPTSETLVPVYARSPDATIPLEGGRLRP